MTEGRGLRELKRDQLRAQLEDTAIAVFAEEGYAETPVDAVARRIQVSPRTVYRYFPMKEDLVLNAERRIHEEALARMLQSRPDDAPLASLEAMIAFFEDLLVERRSRQIAFHRLVARTPELDSAYLALMHGLENDISAALRSRPGIAEIDDAGWSAGLLAAAFTTAHRVAVAAWIESGAEPWLPVIVRRNFALLTRSLEGVTGWSDMARAANLVAKPKT